MTSVSLAFFNAWIIASTTCKSFSSNEFNMASIRFLQLLLEFCVGYLVLGKGQSDSIKTERRTVIDMLNAIDERL